MASSAARTARAQVAASGASAPEPKPIRQLLRERHDGERSRLFWEFRNGTGFDANRSADALAVQFYRTDGMCLIGYEVKHSRGDWQREKEEPAKLEQTYGYCDLVYMVAPNGIIRPEELPAGVGLLEPSRGGQKLRTVRPPTKRPRTEIPRAILVGLIQRAFRDAEQSDRPEIERLADERVKALRAQDEAVLGRYAEREERLRKWEAITGLSLPWPGDNMYDRRSEHIGKLVAEFLSSDGRIEHLRVAREAAIYNLSRGLELAKTALEGLPHE